MKRLVVLVLASSLAARADDCATCTAAKECEIHATLDRDAAKALVEGLRRPDPGARQKAVEAFAAACQKHANCRPAANAQALAAALRDPHAAVFAYAAEMLGTSQDGAAVAAILSKEVDPILKRVAKPAKTDKEQIAWNDDISRLKGIVLGLEACGSPDAGAPMAKLLRTGNLEVMRLAANRCKEVRSREVPPAILDALEACRKMPDSTLRGAVFIALSNSWEVLTASGIKSPVNETSDPNESDRFLREAKAWWQKNGKTWK
ncbi:MAG: hypothetical protein HYY18_16475 [Planctomycetes bacterium]|nr:hypothetical protein [Planctomycetota bacterium]